MDAGAFCHVRPLAAIQDIDVSAARIEFGPAALVDQRDAGRHAVGQGDLEPEFPKLILEQDRVLNAEAPPAGLLGVQADVGRAGLYADLGDVPIATADLVEEA